MELDDIKINISEGGDFEAIPEDVYETMIENIENKMAMNNFSGKEELNLNVVFNITEGEYAGRKLFRRMRPTISIGKPSNLYKLCCAIEGKELDGDHFEKFKLSTLLGRFVRVTVKNVTKGEKTYSNIEGFLASKLDIKLPKKSKEKEATPDEIASEMAEGVK